MRLLAFVLAAALQLGAICINAGGSADAACMADQYFTGGTAYADPSMPIPALRYGNFSYAIPAAPGLQEVTLSFVEPNKNAAGQRLFTTSINGAAVSIAGSEVIDLF